jgi:hypothetical protein
MTRDTLALTPVQTTCVQNCTDKFLKHSERIGARFAEHNAGELPLRLFACSAWEPFVAGSRVLRAAGRRPDVSRADGTEQMQGK